ncbi:L-2-amino-thiazoline-4-carboxylic acid hydrolase [Zongyangia hominis]|uniref:L-2-amino-thiazoline-4-carboxylic acid hydrolase n=1 Tax=Zongyangia hominis TaxID=2763677 RepID=A0A926EF56_9FIRM|nr:L-2-amino-thiazoline-4-carboxylic acid hydrolase [Zongyangia hominis]MBC8570716.1 L-2-amino-thiazoline-4-carboxylic acid hydrolase [Zongyangia hominis]
MSKIKNEVSLHEEKVDINRSAIEHRATWMGLIYDEAKKAGADAEAICRAAVKRCGLFHGAGYKERCEGSLDCRVFKGIFLPELATKTFEMETEQDENNVFVTFHYCPLVSAWQKLGFDDETCQILCDIAMDGDRGIAEANGLHFDLSDTIAAGCPTCKLHLSR